MGTSVPGSAWDRTAREAPPRECERQSDCAHTAGRACKAVRSQAEPGTEGVAASCQLAFLDPRQSLGPRALGAPRVVAPAHIPDYDGPYGRSPDRAIQGG